MRTISNQDLIDANRKALAENKLTAQHHDEYPDACRYVGKDGCGCAIGVALTPKEREIVVERHMNTHWGVRRLARQLGLDLDLHFAERLQLAHDHWANSGQDEQYRELIGVSPT